MSEPFHPKDVLRLWQWRGGNETEQRMESSPPLAGGGNGVGTMVVLLSTKALIENGPASAPPPRTGDPPIQQCLKI